MGLGKITKLGENIPWFWAKNKMKLDYGRGLYHNEPSRCDLSDDLTAIQQLQIIAD